MYEIKQKQKGKVYINTQIIVDGLLIMLLLVGTVAGMILVGAGQYALNIIIK